MGLKTQKKLVEYMKALENGPKSPAVRSSFRKKTLTKEERQAVQAEEERLLQEELKAQKKNQSQALRNLYFTRGEMAYPPVILVDGYNVLMRWLQSEDSSPRLEVARRSLDDARQMLLMEFAEYSQYRGVKLVVVFDALNHHRSSTSREVVAGVEVVYTGDQEADLFLVTEGHTLIDKGCPEVLMATNDREIQDSCADWGRRLHYCSSEQLIAEVSRAATDMAKEEKEQRWRRELGRAPLGPDLKQAEPQLHDRLLELKQQLGRPSAGAASSPRLLRGRR
eukprot:jgi/Botrbrau1/4289/Bobra.0390s0029.1